MLVEKMTQFSQQVERKSRAPTFKPREKLKINIIPINFMFSSNQEQLSKFYCNKLEIKADVVRKIVNNYKNKFSKNRRLFFPSQINKKR